MTTYYGTRGTATLERDNGSTIVYTLEVDGMVEIGEVSADEFREILDSINVVAEGE